MPGGAAAPPAGCRSLAPLIALTSMRLLRQPRTSLGHRVGAIGPPRRASGAAPCVRRCAAVLRAWRMLPRSAGASRVARVVAEPERLPVGDKQADCFRIWLKDALVTSVQLSGSSENPTESATFAFQGVEIAYKAEKDDGSPARSPRPFKVCRLTRSPSRMLSASHAWMCWVSLSAAWWRRR